MLGSIVIVKGERGMEPGDTSLAPLGRRDIRHCSGYSYKKALAHWTDIGGFPEVLPSWSLPHQADTDKWSSIDCKRPKHQAT